jgi:aryl-alcohol dehydrogenase-like predicted oxidoreductase
MILVFLASSKSFCMSRSSLDLELTASSIVEGTRTSLDRLGLDYVDIIFAHCPDVTVPMEEVVRAFNWVIQKGWALYWATSEYVIDISYRMYSDETCQVVCSRDRRGSS